MTSRITATIQKSTYTDYHDDPGMYGLLGERVPIEMLQSQTVKYASMALDYILDEGEFAFMDSNLPIRLDPSDLRKHVAPDYIFSRNVDLASIRDQTAYNLWEVGKPPEFALEVASPSTYEKDLYEKPDIYASIGIGEYWMFDPKGGELYGQALIGFRLVNGKYEPVEIAANEHGLMSGYSEELGVRLCSVENRRREELLQIQPELALVFEKDYNTASLLFQDMETGLYILNMTGLKSVYERAEAEREAAQYRAEEAEAERDSANARATSAEAEVARLREQIRRMEQG